jgi:5-hydroxyisourate hydrolase
MKSEITTHVLDTTKGAPAVGISVLLEFSASQYAWEKIGLSVTNSDGRINDLPSVQAGVYRLTFGTSAYFEKEGIETFYPYIQIVFQIHDAVKKFHIPLLLSPFGYSTYRGS